jgi:hypothetical protein
MKLTLLSAMALIYSTKTTVAMPTGTVQVNEAKPCLLGAKEHQPFSSSKDQNIGTTGVKNSTTAATPPKIPGSTISDVKNNNGIHGKGPKNNGDYPVKMPSTKGTRTEMNDTNDIKISSDGKGHHNGNNRSPAINNNSGTGKVISTGQTTSPDVIIDSHSGSGKEYHTGQTTSQDVFIDSQGTVHIGGKPNAQKKRPEKKPTVTENTFSTEQKGAGSIFFSGNGGSNKQMGNARGKSRDILATGGRIFSCSDGSVVI